VVDRTSRAAAEEGGSAIYVEEAGVANVSEEAGDVLSEQLQLRDAERDF